MTFPKREYSLQSLIDDTRAILDEHIQKDHTPEYEEALRKLPPERPSTPPRYLQFSRCQSCNMLMRNIVDLMNASLVKITLPADFLK